MSSGKKQQFYVQLLGWVETNGLRGARYTDPVVKNLRRKAKQWKNAPMLTLQVGKTEIKMSQDIPDEKKGRKKIKTMKFPIIPSSDITFVSQALNPIDGSLDDVVACIYLGFVPRTQRYVHTHVYRFDSTDTATTFTRILNQIISINTDRTAEIERQLIRQGAIEDARERVGPITAHVRPNIYRLDSSDGMSDKALYEDSGADSGSFSDEGLPSGSDDIEPDLQSLKDAVPFDSVTDELKTRLRLTETKGAAPLLLPPKDYDTIVRRHGDVTKASNRKCLQIPIVGSRNRNGSEESGIEIPSPSNSEENTNSADNKILFAYSNTNDFSSPPTSPSILYPLKTSQKHPLTQSNSYPCGKFSRTAAARTTSSSVISNQSPGSSPAVESRTTILYNGKTRVTDIPPPDYENETNILKQKPGMHSNGDITQRLPAAVFHKKIDHGCTALLKRYDQHSHAGYNETPRVEAAYGQNAGVRRMNSLYR